MSNDSFLDMNLDGGVKVVPEDVIQHIISFVSPVPCFYTLRRVCRLFHRIFKEKAHVRNMKDWKESWRDELDSTVYSNVILLDLLDVQDEVDADIAEPAEEETAAVQEVEEEEQVGKKRRNRKALEKPAQPKPKKGKREKIVRKDVLQRLGRAYPNVQILRLQVDIDMISLAKKNRYGFFVRSSDFSELEALLQQFPRLQQLVLLIDTEAAGQLATGVNFFGQKLSELVSQTMRQLQYFTIAGMQVSIYMQTYLTNLADNFQKLKDMPTLKKFELLHLIDVNDINLNTQDFVSRMNQGKRPGLEIVASKCVEKDEDMREFVKWQHEVVCIPVHKIRFIADHNYANPDVYNAFNFALKKGFVQLALYCIEKNHPVTVDDLEVACNLRLGSVGRAIALKIFERDGMSALEGSMSLLGKCENGDGLIRRLQTADSASNSTESAKPEAIKKLPSEEVVKIVLAAAESGEASTILSMFQQYPDTVRETKLLQQALLKLPVEDKSVACLELLFLQIGLTSQDVAYLPLMHRVLSECFKSWNNVPEAREFIKTLAKFVDFKLLLSSKIPIDTISDVYPTKDMCNTGVEEFVSKLKSSYSDWTMPAVTAFLSTLENACGGAASFYSLGTEDTGYSMLHFMVSRKYFIPRSGNQNVSHVFKRALASVSLVQLKDKQGNTPLHVAETNSDFVQQMLKSDGSNLATSTNTAGRTPFAEFCARSLLVDFAAKDFNKYIWANVLELLIAVEISWTARDKTGLTPIEHFLALIAHAVQTVRRQQLAKILQSLTGPVLAKLINKADFLSKVIACNDLYIVELYLELKAKVGETEAEGATASLLSQLVQASPTNEDVIEKILDQIKDFTLTSSSVQEAIRAGNSVLASSILLKMTPEDISKKDAQGKTSFITAAENGMLSVVNTIVSRLGSLDAALTSSAPLDPIVVALAAQKNRFALDFLLKYDSLVPNSREHVSLAVVRSMLEDSDLKLPATLKARLDAAEQAFAAAKVEQPDWLQLLGSKTCSAVLQNVDGSLAALSALFAVAKHKSCEPLVAFLAEQYRGEPLRNFLMQTRDSRSNDTLFHYLSSCEGTDTADAAQIVRLLVLGCTGSSEERKALLDTKNAAGETALHVSCRHLNECLSQALIQLGASKDIKNTEGKLPEESMESRASAFLRKYGRWTALEIQADATSLKRMPQKRSAPDASSVTAAAPARETRASRKRTAQADDEEPGAASSAEDQPKKSKRSRK